MVRVRGQGWVPMPEGAAGAILLEGPQKICRRCSCCNSEGPPGISVGVVEIEVAVVLRAPQISL